MKRFLVYLTAIMLLVSSVSFVYAGDEKTKKKDKTAKKEKVELQSFTVVGILQAKEMKKKDDGKSRTNYIIVDDNGVAYTIAKKAKPEQYVGKKVKVVGKGMERSNKKGKKRVQIRKVTSIEEVK